MQVIGIAFLLVVANGFPVLVAKLVGDTADWPIDAGKTLADGRPLFGASKTWRGLFSSLLFTVLAAILLGFGWLLGLTVASGATLGDLLSSFIKRRAELPSSAKATGLDQLPEAVIPALFLVLFFHYSWTVALSAAGLFAISDVIASPLLFKLGLRRVPH